MADERCETCRFFTPETASEDGGAGAVCRRFPPVLVDLHVKQVAKIEKWLGGDVADLRECWVYPRVDEDDWCGEYRLTPGTA